MQTTFICFIIGVFVGFVINCFPILFDYINDCLEIKRARKWKKDWRMWRKEVERACLERPTADEIHVDKLPAREAFSDPL